MNQERELWPRVEETCVEAEVGAEWWTALLRDPEDVEFDNGDPMYGALVRAMRDPEQHSYDSDVLDEYQSVLAEKIQGGIERRRTWDLDEPEKGSTVIKCDYHTHPVLADAGEEVGIDVSGMMTFPSKTTMWLDPGRIRVRSGYTSDIECIWEVGNFLEEIREEVDKYNFETKVYPISLGYRIKVYREDPDSEFGAKEGKAFDINTETGEWSDIVNQLGDVWQEAREWREGVQ
ncbi:MAG: hypothetical protein ABEH81_01280 [Halopenitus sp.]